MISASQRLTVVKILLGPVLLFQSRWVRQKIPVLPEPVTQIEGVCGTGKAFSLLLLGDSSAAGVGAPVAEQSLLGQLLMLLSRSHRVSYQLMAEAGKTTAEMLVDLTAVDVQHFDLVVTALGVNDITSQVAVGMWESQQKQLIAEITGKFTPKQIIMSGLPPVREFPALSWPLNAYMGAYADHWMWPYNDYLSRMPRLTF